MLTNYSNKKIQSTTQNQTTELYKERTSFMVFGTPKLSFFGLPTINLIKDVPKMHKIEEFLE
jgi:hypothetical protein